MSKARPNAYIYEKWLSGIEKAVPDAAERCALLTYICRYQFAKIYGCGDMPDSGELSQAANVALCLLEGDLQELAEARTDSNEERSKNGRTSHTPANPYAGTDTLAGPSRPKQAQAGPIQNKSNQINTNNIPYIPLRGGDKLEEDGFLIGLDLIEKGRIIDHTELLRVWDKAKKMQADGVLRTDKRSYVAKCFQAKNESGQGLAVANFIRACGFRGWPTLEVRNVECTGGVLYVTCTAAAIESIEAEINKAEKTERVRAYMLSVGAQSIIYKQLAK